MQDGKYAMDEDTLESALQTLQNRLCHRLAFGMMSLCKNYLKDRSTGRAGLNGYSAVMYAHDFTNQGQPKAYSAELAASGFIYTKEWFKYAFFLIQPGFRFRYLLRTGRCFFPSGMRLR